MRKNLLFNVAEYIRLSKEDGDKAESDSIGNQRKLIADYLKDKEEFVLYDVYVDDGYTGTNFNRPFFQRMLADIEAGHVNCVIVKDLSRFGRDYIDTGKYLERYFPERDIRFIAITDNIDSFKQSYDMMLPIKNVFNEQYARDISKKVHTSMHTKQKAGEFIGAFPSYGYKKSPVDKNKLVIDEYASDIVRRIFSLYISGYGKIRIAGILNEEGIVCPSEYKNMNGDNYRNSKRLNSTSYWTYSTINRILHNEMYRGNMVQGKTIQYMHGKARSREKEDWIVVKDTHDAIIDIDTWNKAQRLLKCRTRSLDLTSNTSIFAGFLKCGECGRALCKKNRTYKGARHSYYQCSTYVRSGLQFCTPHTVAYSVLEKIILNDLSTIIRSVDNLKELVEKQRVNTSGFKPADCKEQTRLENELQRIGKLKKEVYEDYKEELITKAEYISYRKEYIQKEEFLEKQLADMLAKQEADPDTDILKKPWIKHLLELRNIERLDRDIMVEMVSEIRVYENHKIVVIYNFSNELDSLLTNTYQQQEESENF